jgi:hypothetical protein
VRAQRGEHDAFARLIEPRAGRMLRTARSILGNETDAYEAAQEALIAAWVDLPGLRDAIAAILDAAAFEHTPSSSEASLLGYSIPLDDAARLRGFVWFVSILPNGELVEYRQ